MKRILLIGLIILLSSFAFALNCEEKRACNLTDDYFNAGLAIVGTLDNNRLSNQVCLSWNNCVYVKDIIAGSNITISKVGMNYTINSSAGSGGGRTYTSTDLNVDNDLNKINFFNDLNIVGGVKAIKFFGKLDYSNLVGAPAIDVNGTDINVNNFWATHVVDIDWDWDDAFQKGQTITTSAGGTFTVTDQAPTETGLVITSSGGNTVQLSVDATDAWIGLSGAQDLVLNIQEGDSLRAGDTAFADLGAPDFKWRNLWLSGGLSVVDVNILDLNVGGDINANAVKANKFFGSFDASNLLGTIGASHYTDTNGGSGFGGFTQAMFDQNFFNADHNTSADANRNAIKAIKLFGTIDASSLLGTIGASHYTDTNGTGYGFSQIAFDQNFFAADHNTSADANRNAIGVSRVFLNSMNSTNGNIFVDSNVIIKGDSNYGLMLRKIPNGSMGSYSINYKNEGSKYPIRIALADDATTHRYLQVGYYTSNNFSQNLWKTAFEVDSYAGDVNVGHDLNVGSAIKATNIYGNTVDISGDLRGSRISFVLNEKGVFSCIPGAEWLKVGNTDTNSERGIVATRAGSIVGVSLSYDIDVATVKNCQIVATINGSDAWANVFDDAVGVGKSAYFTQARNSDAFSAGDDLALYIESTAGAPGPFSTGGNIIATIEVVYDT